MRIDTNSGAGAAPTHTVTLLTRPGCGSCVRVREQIAPMLAEESVPLEVVDVENDAELRMEFGDRLPVVLLDGEEYAAWEVETEELRADVRS